MFIVQGVGRVLRDPEAARAAEEHYDGILQHTEGMYWNIYLERLNDPSITIHTQDWHDQRTSEDFGVSPAFMENRRMVAPGGLPLSKSVHELSPGYWKPVRNFEYRTPPTGYDYRTLGVAHQSIVTVISGREKEYEAAENAIGDALASVDGCYWFRYFHSLGYPNTYSRIIHWRDQAAAEAGLQAIADLDAARVALIKDETGDLCRVKLFSDWPDRRARAGF